jgi:hypothetical protein
MVQNGAKKARASRVDRRSAHVTGGEGRRARRIGTKRWAPEVGTDGPDRVRDRQSTSTDRGCTARAPMCGLRKEAALGRLHQYTARGKPGRVRLGRFVPQSDERSVSELWPAGGVAGPGQLGSALGHLIGWGVDLATGESQLASQAGSARWVSVAGSARWVSVAGSAGWGSAWLAGSAGWHSLFSLLILKKMHFTKKIFSVLVNNVLAENARPARSARSLGQRGWPAWLGQLAGSARWVSLDGQP